MEKTQFFPGSRIPWVLQSIWQITNKIITYKKPILRKYWLFFLCCRFNAYSFEVFQEEYHIVLHKGIDNEWKYFRNTVQGPHIYDFCINVRMCKDRLNILFYFHLNLFLFDKQLFSKTIWDKVISFYCHYLGSFKSYFF